jgi:hypothetical protein
MNPNNVPTGGKDPVTGLRNVGTLENPRWVDENSSDWAIYQHTIAQRNSTANAVPAVVVPDSTPLIILAVGSFALYFLWKKFMK